MNNYKRQGGFGGGRRNFGGDRGFKGGKGFGRQMEMFQATCASCGKTCEVPFKPNGKKPVYCKECFAENGGGADASRPQGDRFSDRRPFARNDAPQRPQASSETGELKKQIEALGRKLDKIVALLEKTSEAPLNASSEVEAFPVAANMPPEAEPKEKKKATKKKK